MVENSWKTSLARRSDTVGVCNGCAYYILLRLGRVLLFVERFWSQGEIVYSISTRLALYTCLIKPASLPYCVLGRPLATPSPLNLCSNPEGYPGAFGNGLSYRTGAFSGKAWPVRGSCHAWGCLEKAFRPEKSCSRAAGSFFSCHRARRRRYRGEVLPAGQTKER